VVEGIIARNRVGVTISDDGYLQTLRRIWPETICDATKKAQEIAAAGPNDIRDIIVNFTNAIFAKVASGHETARDRPPICFTIQPP
jgi:hypothetical protein